MRTGIFAVFAALALNACAAGDGRESEGETSADLTASQNGITTCGPNGNESCATKLPVKISDSKTILLGKYDITAGRFRQFVNATNGDLQSYTRAHQPAWWNGAWRSKIASGSGVGNAWSDAGGYGYDWTIWLPASKDDVGYVLGPWNFGIAGGDFAATGGSGYSGESAGARPAVDANMYGPGNEGCQVADYGARTYWQSNGATGGDDNLYAQADLDSKALNCVSFYSLAAFCAWDGGRLPTTAELDAAWGAETYPWGETTPYYADFDGTPQENGPKDLANYGNAGGEVYAKPAQKGNDDSNHLSSPGAFPKGNGPYGHADLAGLVMAMTGDIAQGTIVEQDDSNNSKVTVKNAPVVTWHRGGSWQGHKVEKKSPYQFIATNKYLAMGGRCAYDQTTHAAPNGFSAEYFGGSDLATSRGVRIDPYVAFSSATFANPASSNPKTPYSVRWTANLTPRYSETYTFTTVAGDGMRVTVNGQRIIDDWTTHGVATKTGTIALTASQPVSIQIEHYNAAGNGVNAKVLWSSASQLTQVIPATALTP